MQCLQATELISLSMDAEIDDVQESQLRLHLDECAECRIQFDRMMALDELFTDLDLVAPPPEFKANVMAAVQRRSALQGLMRGGLIMLAVLATGSLIALLPVAGLAATAFENPSVLQAVLRVWMRVSSLFGTFISSITILIRALVFGPYASASLVCLSGVVIGIWLWIKLVTWHRPTVSRPVSV